MKIVAVIVMEKLRCQGMLWKLIQSYSLQNCWSDEGTLNDRIADTPQFRGGNPYFFSENPYQSVSFIYVSMTLYRENVHAIHIAMQFAKKSRHCVIKIDSQQQRTKIGASFHVARQSDCISVMIRPAPLIPF